MGRAVVGVQDHPLHQQQAAPQAERLLGTREQRQTLPGILWTLRLSQEPEQHDCLWTWTLERLRLEKAELNLKLSGICHPLHLRYASLSWCLLLFISNGPFSCNMGNVLVEDGMALSLLFFSPYLFHVCLFFCFLFKNIIDRICFSSFAVLYLL